MIFRIFQLLLVLGLCASQTVDVGSQETCNQYKLAEQDRLHATLLLQELSTAKSMFDTLKSLSEERSATVIMADIDNIVAHLTTLISTYSTTSWEEALPFIVDAAGWGSDYPETCSAVVNQIFIYRKQIRYLEEILMGSSLSHQRMYECLISENISECQDSNTPPFVLSVSHNYDAMGSYLQEVAAFRSLYKTFFDEIFMIHPYIDTMGAHDLWFRAVTVIGGDWGNTVEDELFNNLSELNFVFFSLYFKFSYIKVDFIKIESIVRNIYHGDSDVSDLLGYTELIKLRLPQLNELSVYIQENIEAWTTLTQTVRANKPDGVAFLSSTRTIVEGNELYHLRKRISACLANVAELMELSSSQMIMSSKAMKEIEAGYNRLLMPWKPILQNYFTLSEIFMSYFVCSNTTLETSRVLSILYRRESQWNTNFDLSSEYTVLNAYLTDSEDKLPMIKSFLKSQETNLMSFRTYIEAMSNGNQGNDPVFIGSAPTAGETTAYQNISARLANNLNSFVENQCNLNKSLLYAKLIIELEPKSESELSNVSEYNASSELDNYNEIFDHDEIVTAFIDKSSITDATLVRLMDASLTSLTSRMADIAGKFNKVTTLINQAHTAYITQTSRSTMLSGVISNQRSLNFQISAIENALRSLYALPTYVGQIITEEVLLDFPFYVAVDVVPEGTEFLTNYSDSSLLDLEESTDGLFGSLMPDDILTAVENSDNVSSYSDDLGGASAFSFTDKNTNTKGYMFIWDKCEFLCNLEITFRDVNARLAVGFGVTEKESDEIYLKKGVFMVTVPITAYEVHGEISLNVITNSFSIRFNFDGQNDTYDDMDRTSDDVLMNYSPIVTIIGSASMTVKHLYAAAISVPWTLSDMDLPLYYEFEFLDKPMETKKFVYVKKGGVQNGQKKWLMLQNLQPACTSLGVAFTSEVSFKNMLFGFFFDGMNVVSNPYMSCFFNPIIQSIRMPEVDETDGDAIDETDGITSDTMSEIMEAMTTGMDTEMMTEAVEKAIMAGMDISMMTEMMEQTSMTQVEIASMTEMMEEAITNEMETETNSDVKEKPPIADEVTEKLYMSYLFKEVTVYGKKKINIQLEFFSMYQNYLWNVNTTVDYELVPSFIYEKGHLVELTENYVVTPLDAAPELLPIAAQDLCVSEPDCGGERSCVQKKACNQTGKRCRWSSHCRSEEVCANTQEWMLSRCEVDSTWTHIWTFIDSVFLTIGRFFSRWLGVY